MEQYMLPCVHKKIFGIDCFGCGTQRAIMLLLEGDIVAAFKMFPAIYTTIILFILIILNFTDKKRNYHKIIIITALVNAFIMVFSYIYKHLT